MAKDTKMYAVESSTRASTIAYSDDSHLRTPKQMKYYEDWTDSVTEHFPVHLSETSLQFTVVESALNVQRNALSLNQFNPHATSSALEFLGECFPTSNQ